MNLKQSIMNKIILFLGALGLLGLTTVASAQNSEQYFVSGGLSYKVLSADDHTVEVAGGESCDAYRGNLNIPATVTNNGETYDVVALGEMAFYGASLSGLTIPSSVVQIKESCFRDASGLTTINISASVTSIETWALAAAGLKTINVDENNPNYTSIDGILFSKDTLTLEECPRGKSGTITLPQNTRHIAPCAFCDCKSITGVTLPDGLSSIDLWAFVRASHLNNIVIPSTVTYLGDALFGGCSALNNLTIADGNTRYYMDGMAIYSAGGDSLVSCHKSADTVILPNTLRYVSGFMFNSNVKYVYVPDGVTTIGGNAFSNSSLVSIVLPSHLERMEGYAFDYCTSLAAVSMPLTLDTMGRACFELCTNLSSIAIPNGLRTVPREAFMYCTALSHITWGDDIEIIDSYAFGNCAMNSLQLPPSLKIGRYEAFWKGRKLKRVEFSAPLDTIEWGAFEEHSIRTLLLKNTLPPATTSEGDYDGCLYGTTVDTIVIPCGTLDTYLADSYWGQFADFYYEDCSGIEEAIGSRQPAVSVYPNPTHGMVYIDGGAGAIRSAEVYNVRGEKVSVRVTAEGVDMSALPAGVYYMILTTERGVCRHKVVRLRESSQKATAAAAATLSESTPCCMGMTAVWSQASMTACGRPSPSLPSTIAMRSCAFSRGSSMGRASSRNAIATVANPSRRNRSTQPNL